jgi:hypothetical protein
MQVTQRGKVKKKKSYIIADRKLRIKEQEALGRKDQISSGKSSNAIQQ